MFRRENILPRKRNRSPKKFVFWYPQQIFVFIRDNIIRKTLDKCIELQGDHVEKWSAFYLKTCALYLMLRAHQTAFILQDVKDEVKTRNVMPFNQLRSIDTSSFSFSHDNPFNKVVYPSGLFPTIAAKYSFNGVPLTDRNRCSAVYVIRWGLAVYGIVYK